MLSVPSRVWPSNCRLALFQRLWPSSTTGYGISPADRGRSLWRLVPSDGDGNQTRDFTYVGDIVAGTLAAARNAAAGSVLNLGGGSTISMNEVIAIVQSEFPSLRIKRLDQGRGDARDTRADFTRARESIGYEPQTTVVEGMARQIDWHRKRQDSRRSTNAPS